MADWKVRDQGGSAYFGQDWGHQRYQVSLHSGFRANASLALGDWLENLPPSLVVNYHSPKNCMPHVLMMHLSHAWLVILLHRPFYRPLAGLPSGSTAKDTNPATSKAAWAVKVSQPHLLPLTR